MYSLSYSEYISTLNKDQLLEELKQYSVLYRKNPRKGSIRENGLALMKVVSDKAELSELKKLCNEFTLRLQSNV